MREASKAALPTAKIQSAITIQHGGWDLVAAEDAESHKKEIGMGLRDGDDANLLRREDSNLRQAD